MHRQNGLTALYAIRSNLKQEAAELVTTTRICHPLRVLFVGRKPSL